MFRRRKYIQKPLPQSREQRKKKRRKKRSPSEQKEKDKRVEARAEVKAEDLKIKCRSGDGKLHYVCNKRGLEMQVAVSPRKIRKLPPLHSSRQMKDRFEESTPQRALRKMKEKLVRVSRGGRAGLRGRGPRKVEAGAPTVRDPVKYIKHLLNIGFTNEQVLNMGFEAEELYEAGFTAEWGDTAQELRKKGFTAQQLHDELGFEAWELREGGFHASQLKDAGFTVQEIGEAGYKNCELFFEGFGFDQLRSMGVPEVEIASAFPGCLSVLRKAGFTAHVLREAGYSADRLLWGGFTLEQLKDGGFKESRIERARARRQRLQDPTFREGVEEEHLRSSSSDATS